VDTQTQFLTSHAIFNCHAYAKQVDRIISYKSSSFSIRDVVFRSTLPTPKALRPKTYNNFFEVNLTKVSFAIGGHCSVTINRLSHFTLGFDMSTTNNLLIIPPLHDHGICQNASFYFSMVLMLRTSFKS
jgi:hypothetical protein